MASGEDAVLDFATFKEEFDAFTEFAFAPTDTELGDTRGPWGPWLDELACKKIGSELKKLLARVAWQHEDQTVTMVWLCDPLKVDDNFKYHATSLKDRGLRPSAVAQTMRSFSRPLAWALGELGHDATRHECEELFAKYQAICTHLNFIGYRDYSSRDKSKKLEAVDKPGVSTEEYKSAMSKYVQRVCDDSANGGPLDTSVSKAHAAVLELAPYGRRGVMIYRMVFSPNMEHCLDLVKEDLLPSGATVLVVDPTDYLLYTPGEKGHEVLVEATSTPVLEMFLDSRSFDAGEYLFTPRICGMASEKDYFDSATYSAFFLRLTTNLLGLPLRPKAMRQMRSATVVDSDVTNRVAASTAWSMATSLRQINERYSSNSLMSEGWLASQVSKFECDTRFAGSLQTVVMPALSTHGELVFMPARWVRTENQSTALFTLFVEATPGRFELGATTIRCSATGTLATISCKLAMELAGAGSQRWRARVFSAMQAKEHFHAADCNMPDWVASSACSLSPERYDLVLSLNEFVVCEVKAVLPGGSLELFPSVEVNLLQQHSGQSMFRFQHSAKNIVVDAKAVAFPIDLTFERASATFILRKSANMESV